MPGIRDDFIYAAGLFDGEGCVHLSISDRGPTRNADLQVSIGMRSRVPFWLQETFGGFLVLQGELVRWIPGNREVQQFLEGILPFSKHKGPEIELALAFLETKVKVGRRLEEPELIWLARERIALLLVQEKDKWRDLQNGTVELEEVLCLEA